MDKPIKLTAAHRARLLEAMDRYTRFHPGEELTEARTGLGFHTDYKPMLDAGLMTWVHSKPMPRCTGWLRLTEAGARIVRIWLDFQAYLDEEITK